MKALFVELPAFERNRSAYLTDEALRGLQNAMLKTPEAGDVITGTGGLRKVRHGDSTRGKGKARWSQDHLLLVGAQKTVLAFHALRQGRLVTERKSRIKNTLKARVGGKKMTKRNLFAELTEGFDALAAERKGKRTLRTTEVTLKPVVEVSAAELRAIREKLNLSRPVFASYLRTNPRTLENWEQGRAKPNAQAALLIHLVSRYPDTVSQTTQSYAHLSQDTLLAAANAATLAVGAVMMPMVSASPAGQTLLAQ